MNLETDNYKFSQHKSCEFFPCHAGADPETFSCLFCYCPLYSLGDKCGGNFEYLPSGVKSCEKCLVPHRKENFDRIMEKLGDVIEQVKRPPVEEKNR